MSSWTSCERRPEREQPEYGRLGLAMGALAFLSLSLRCIRISDRQRFMGCVRYVCARIKNSWEYYHSTGLFNCPSSVDETGSSTHSSSSSSIVCQSVLSSAVNSCSFWPTFVYNVTTEVKRSSQYSSITIPSALAFPVPLVLIAPCHSSPLVLVSDYFHVRRGGLRL